MNRTEKKRKEKKKQKDKPPTKSKTLSLSPNFQMQFPLSRPISSLSFSPPNPNTNPRNKTLSLLLSLPFQNHSTITDHDDGSSSNNNNNDHRGLLISERGLKFHTGDSFFRSESAVGRDLAVLSAALHKRSNQNLRVLDAMCGCGVRSLRYLRQAGADFVWANDANEDYRHTIVSNLSGEIRVSDGGTRRWVVTHSDANRVLVERYLERDFFDLIDVDSFGSDSGFLRSAIAAVRIGGLVYGTSTDGYSSGGHRPQHGMWWICKSPIVKFRGGALREAVVLGFHISPLFSYYSYHGPVFRVMFRVNRGKLPDNGCYGFISYCNLCGNSQAFSWHELGKISCPCSNGEVSRSLVVSGPLWTGPLHDGDYVTEMLKLAEEWGWTGNGMKGTDLEKLLKQMIDESDPDLPFGYIRLDEVASRAKVNSPPLRTIISTLHEEGYAASRSHIASNAIKTNCPMSKCIQIAKQLQSL
ncbi:tRNA (guanine(26)-N(2))-dimethyltransferase isoform X2 [Magnolia sinica]|uniref:tRNA (guanine(26)-N(2))-dimethyltransferase isoform X2 n=1 Tax=Magnolia sinica TaxID=86752 RepID=UPI0026590BD7|nr:tRNA (guanine(26)-N(2))-dimethyltransferase isoform X2 [Magnolia sinica]